MKEAFFIISIFILTGLLILQNREMQESSNQLNGVKAENKRLRGE